jgi:hypothetical protein
MKAVLESIKQRNFEGAMNVLIWVKSGHNKRTGYQKPPRLPLLADGLILWRELKEALNTQEKQEPTPEAPTIAETPVDQLVRLSLAVQSGEPVTISNDVASKTVETSPEGVTVDR